MSYSQEVELVISTGWIYSQSTSFSNDGAFLVTGTQKTIYIWDVNTGREVRRTLFTSDQTHTMDSVWFSEDDTKVIVGLMMSNDRYHVDVLTGKSVFVKSDVQYDYSQPFKKSVMMKANEHMASSSREDLVYPSPDGKHELRLRKVKNPYDVANTAPFNYMTVLRSGDKETEQPDTAYLADIAFSRDGKMVYSNKKIYSLETHRMLSELKLAPYAPMGISFLPGTHIPVTGAQDHIRIWDFPTVRTIPIKGLAQFKFAPGYTHAIAELWEPKSKKKKLARVDIRQEKVLEQSTANSELGYLTSVGPEARVYAVIDMNQPKGNPMGTTYAGLAVDAVTGKQIKRFKNSTQLLCIDEVTYIVDSMAGKHKVYHLKDGNLADYPEPNGPYTYAYTLSNNKKYALGYVGGEYQADAEGNQQTKIAAWDYLAGERVFEQFVTGISFTAYEVSADDKYYAFGDLNGTIFVYDLKSGEKQFELTGHTAMVQELAFSDDSKRLLSASYDGTRKVWNLETGKEQVSLISIGREDFAIVTPDQYYYSTKGATKNIHFVKGMEIFPFAQFDLKYNRPDIILERMMASHQEMIRPYNLAYQKRLKRLGFSEDMLSGEFHMPELVITNADEFPFTTSSQNVELSLRCVDSKYKLDRILVRVNGVPVHGKKGLSIRDMNLRSVGKKVPVLLAPGNNTISVSVMNEKGVESLADNLDIAYTPAEAKLPDLHLFTIGVSKYEQSQFDLKYAAKDASDISSMFTAAHAPFAQVYTHHITDGEVTTESVEKMKQALSETTVDDVVCVFFAGHGLLDGDLNYFLASHNVNFEEPGDKGIPYEMLEDLLDGIPARKKLMLIDACHSGEIDKEEVAVVSNVPTNEGDVVFRAVGSSGIQQVGLNNSFELMKELFTDIRKNSGAMIISSAGGTEYAMEGDQWNNGVFTFSFLDGLKNGAADLNGDQKIMMSEINEYIRGKVSELTDGRQRPTTRAEAIDLDFRLW